MSSAYYARLAAVAMMNHGMNRDNHHQLARWAEYAAAHSLTNRGVLVTGDGRLHAETVLPPPPPPDHMGVKFGDEWRRSVIARWRTPGHSGAPR